MLALGSCTLLLVLGSALEQCPDDDAASLLQGIRQLHSEARIEDDECTHLQRTLDEIPDKVRHFRCQYACTPGRATAEYAVFTFVSPAEDTLHYERPAAVLGDSIRRHITKNIRRFAIMIADDPLREEQQKMLLSSGWDLCTAPLFVPPKPTPTSRWQEQFVKLILWNHPEFKRNLYFDADTVLIDNYDDVFDTHFGDDQYLAGVRSTDARNVNMGMALVRPDSLELMRIFDDLTNVATKYEFFRSEQAFLNTYYPESRRVELPLSFNGDIAFFGWNMMEWNNCSQPLKTVSNEYIGRCPKKMLHFTMTKPWDCDAPGYCNCEGKEQGVGKYKGLCALWDDAKRQADQSIKPHLAVGVKMGALSLLQAHAPLNLLATSPENSETVLRLSHPCPIATDVTHIMPISIQCAAIDGQVANTTVRSGRSVNFWMPQGHEETHCQKQWIDPDWWSKPVPSLVDFNSFPAHCRQLVGNYGCRGDYTAKHGFISAGGDLAVEVMTLKDAQLKCFHLDGCEGFTYNRSKDNANRLLDVSTYTIYFKRGHDFSSSPDWMTFTKKSARKANPLPDECRGICDACPSGSEDYELDGV